MRRSDDPRKELIPGQSEALLRELHLVGRDGKLQADTLRKLKQVNHLVQLLEPALADVRARHPEAQLLDAGAGNAYLGFVLYELFLREGAEVLWSVESRAELVQKARERAARLGYQRMRFLPVPLEEAARPPAVAAAQPANAAKLEVESPTAAAASSAPRLALPERLHLVTALHACDTATDDAIALGVRRKADHIAVVPCCQAEVAAQLKAAPRAAAPWPQLWAHALHRREAGALLTNAVRALSLEALGYQVTVTELTGWEHSLKNELILARRVGASKREPREKLRALLAATGIRPKVVRELLPDLLPAETSAAAAGPSAAAAGPSPDAAAPPQPAATETT